MRCPEGPGAIYALLGAWWRERADGPDAAHAGGEIAALDAVCVSFLSFRLGPTLVGRAYTTLHHPSALPMVAFIVVPVMVVCDLGLGLNGADPFSCVFRSFPKRA